MIAPSARLHQLYRAEIGRENLAPLKSASLPHICIPDCEHDHKHDHLKQSEYAQRVHLHRPRIKRGRFHIKNHEKHRDKVESNGETSAYVGCWLNAAFVRFTFYRMRL